MRHLKVMRHGEGVWRVKIPPWRAPWHTWCNLDEAASALGGTPHRGRRHIRTLQFRRIGQWLVLLRGHKPNRTWISLGGFAASRKSGSPRPEPRSTGILAELRDGRGRE